LVSALQGGGNPAGVTLFPEKFCFTFFLATRYRLQAGVPSLLQKLCFSFTKEKKILMDKLICGLWVEDGGGFGIINLFYNICGLI
ncbi:MAG: hypothetical protein LUF87_06965, partial [Alistipes sp.]|nr:hypothetical protein [Alistipes sp.]